MRSRIRKARKCRGVSFIELLVAVVILALTAAGLFNLFSASKRWTEFSQSKMTVGEVGKLILDPMQAQVREDQWGANCISAGVGCGPASINIQNRQYQIQYTVGNGPLPNLRKVRTDINWNEPVF